MNDKSRLTILICLLLAVATFAAYWSSLHNGTVNFDDPIYLTKNPHVQAGVTGESVRWAFSKEAVKESSNWHPLTWLSLMLDSTIYKATPEHPFGYHLTSLLLHILAAILLFLALSRSTGYIWRSAFVAALFALHPTHVESVAWISERKDVLSAVFWMLTMLAYVWYSANRAIWRYVLVLGAFAIGLTAKPMLVSLPIVLLLLDYWPLGRARTQPWMKLCLEKLPLLALTAIACGITMFAQRAGNAIAPASYIPIDARLANAVVAYARYVGKAVWPSNLSAIYGHLGRTLQPGVVAEIIVAGLLLVAISAAVCVASRKRPYAATGWLWFIVTLIPVIGIVQVGPQGMADRYTYLPFVGLFIIAAWGIPDLLQPRPIQQKPAKASRKSKKARVETVVLPKPRSPLITAIPAVAILGLLGVLTHIQAGYWRDSITLFERSSSAAGESPVAFYNIACAQLNKGDYKSALVNYEKARELKPDAAKILNGCGNALNGLGRYHEAVQRYREAIQAEPERPEPHANLGITLVNMGRVDEAIGEFREAIRLNPNIVEVHTNLGVALTRKNLLDEAETEFRTTIKLDPKEPTAHYNLMGIYLYRKDLANARSEARAYEALGGKIDPQTKAQLSQAK